ncbi:peptidase M16 domain protein [Rippkaea orientalis PCC 8801]|uniref:Peptidase M16 domain protein n=1 Tax=Rippkaea orientalis (strain PCC 8801 / RF-1) TaxID=41431 RepID=B7K671_RIPO1|nr:pitrilysin family protein [Rippkaea orientalis]ACK68124.1 peptidase M16 domain protein [Rippkaea orientalis PCC 8801]
MVQLIDRFKTVPYPANLIQLDHGLTLIHQYQPATPVAVVDVWVKAGTIVEPDNWSGMAHFLEHMIFKGSKRVLPGIFDQMIENSGGMANAATSYDYAHFFLTTAAEYLPDTLPYLAEILLHAEIPDEEFVRERDVVLEEIRSCYDDPDWLAFQSLCESLYQRHPYGRSILGHESQLLQHSPHQMRCFHRTHYQPDKMTVVVVGNLQEEVVLKLVNQEFGEFSAPSECPPIQTLAEPPLLEVRRTQMYLPRLEQARLLMGWIGPGVDCLEDGFGLDLISAILGVGRSSRLVQQLREQKHLVLDVESSFSLQRDSSLFTIAAWLDPQDLEIVEQLILDNLMELQVKPVTEEELERGKRLLCHDYIFSTETPGQLAGLYGYYQTIASAEVSLSYPRIIEQFSAKDLQRIADQYLSPERYAITVMQPC